MKNIKLLTLLVTSLLVFNSCDKDDDQVVQPPLNLGEIITTVKLTLTSGTNVVTLTVKDIDGEGPSVPVFTREGNIMANTTYTGKAEFFNEFMVPVEDITEEIEEEGLEHQIFYQPSPGIGTFTYTDLDSAGNPIGLTFSYVTGSAATGDMTLTLRHEPNKSAPGVSAGNIANAGGETDVEVEFPIIVN